MSVTVQMESDPALSLKAARVELVAIDPSQLIYFGCARLLCSLACSPYSARACARLLRFAATAASAAS
eukprot:2406174-Pleurochrysis_carterae.AAC.1